MSPASGEPTRNDGRARLARALALPPDAEPATLWRLLRDPCEPVWRVAAGALGRRAAEDPAVRAALVEGLADRRWRARAVTGLVALAGTSPRQAIPIDGHMQPVLVWVEGRLAADGPLADAVAVLDALGAPGSVSATLEGRLLERLELAPMQLRAAILGCLARGARAEHAPRARATLEPLVRWRPQTVSAGLAQGRAVRHALRWAIDAIRALDAPAASADGAEQLSRLYREAGPTCRREILLALHAWALDDPELPVPRGLFDGAGSRVRGPLLDELLDAVEGASLGRRLLSRLTASQPPETWLGWLGTGDFLGLRGEPAPAGSDRGLAFAARLVRGEERAVYQIGDAFGDLTRYRRRGPANRAGLLLALHETLGDGLRLDGLADGARPDRLADLHERLAATGPGLRLPLLVGLARAARAALLVDLGRVAVELLIVAFDAADAPLANEALGLVAPLLVEAPMADDRLARLVELICTRTWDDAPERVPGLIWRLVETRVSPAFLEQVASLAREPRLAELLQALARLLRAGGTRRLAGAGPGELLTHLDAASAALGALPAESDDADLSRLLIRLRLLRTLLGTPLLVGMADYDPRGWDDALKPLTGPGLDPRAFTHHLREVREEAAAFGALDFDALRERRATLARLEERVERLQLAGGELPLIEGRLLAAAARSWLAQLDLAERTLLLLTSSVLAGRPAELLGLTVGETEAEGFRWSARLAQAREGLYRFRLRRLVRRHDLDRALALFRRGPRAEAYGLEGDRLHGRLLMAGLLLMFGPYLLYPFAGPAVAGLHLGLSMGAIGGLALLLAASGRRQPGTVLPLIMPRLLGAIVTWYFVIAPGPELWHFTAALDASRLILLLGATTLGCTIYTRAEIARDGDPRRRARAKTVGVLATGLLGSHAVGLILTSSLGPAMLADRLEAAAAARVLGIPVFSEPLGIPFFPVVLLAWSFLMLFLGMFLNLLLEGKGIQEPAS